MVEQLKIFFTINEIIVHFVHGQVFLVLGVVMAIVAIQWRQRSRLELANALPWLAGFAIMEAIATWGNSFIPIQARLSLPDTIQTLRFAQLIVYLLMFATLLGFGLKLNEPQLPSWAAIYVPLVVVLVGATLLTTQRAVINGVDAVQNASSEALLRYAIGIPAALLVAFGLRQQAARLVIPLKSSRLVNVLRVAGFGFIFYAFVEGAITPAAPFFPANTFNEAWLYDRTGIPMGIIRSIVGTVIAWFLFRSLEAFRLEANRLQDSLRQQQSLIVERERISRDLHDGTIQSIYAAGLMLDDVRHTLTHNAPQTPNAQIPEAANKLQNVMRVLDTTIEEVRGYIHDLRHRGAGEEDLARGLSEIVTEFRLRTGIPTDWSADGCGTFALPPEQRQHVYQIAREALSNVSRHARATRAKVTLQSEDCTDEVASLIHIRISDNGIGNVNAIMPNSKLGRGLLNMRERATLLGAHLDVISKPNTGTEVVLELRVIS